MSRVERIGRYEVLSHLASGGMGQVYLARATGLGGFERRVVVKTLDAPEPDDEVLVTMFLDEARVVGGLNHHHIAPVYEVGCDLDGRYFLVMDYVHGQTAEAVWKAATDRGTPLPLGFALTVTSAIARALAYAHGSIAPDGTPLRIVHRDVSLSNVMVGYDGAVKLIDFGIAKAANRATTTQAGTLKGKIGYVSPEQVLDHPIDHRADIFALGVVLYELTTMTHAFLEASQLLTLERIARGMIVPPSRRVPDYPPDLEAIVMKALSVAPERRHADAAAFASEVEAVGRRIGVPLGDTPIVDVMLSLYDSRGQRRRFPRASTDPSERLDAGATTSPIEVRGVAAELPTQVRPPVPVPSEPSPGEAEAAPLVVRIAVSRTTTANVKPLPPPVAAAPAPVLPRTRVTTIATPARVWPWILAAVVLALAVLAVLAWVN